MINAPVLVLNQNYEPLNVCDIRRAFRLLGAEKAELLARNHQVIRTPTVAIPAPSVIRLQYHVKRPQPRVKLSRREVFSRTSAVVGSVTLAWRMSVPKSMLMALPRGKTSVRRAQGASCELA